MRKFSMCLLLSLCLLFTGCGEEKTRSIVDLTVFDDVASSNGFEVESRMEVYSGVNYIIDAKIARYDDIEIEVAGFRRRFNENLL